MTQRLDGETLQGLANLAKREGMSRTKFATTLGISFLAADILFMRVD